MSLNLNQVRAAAGLLEEGCTVPFIARYRKEATGLLDEVAITDIRDRAKQLDELDKRRHTILDSLTERDLLTDELREAITGADAMAVLEDLYLPYRPKRRTRASIAKEKGLGPLADIIFLQECSDTLAEASAFIDPEKGVESADDALAGARDIIAERINEDPDARAAMRDLFARKGTIKSHKTGGQEEQGAKFRDSVDWEEDVEKAPGHRVLAMFRGENEGVLSLRIRPPEETAIGLLKSRFVRNRGPSGQEVSAAAEDGYNRLLAPSMETEIRNEIKKRADEEAIRVFGDNLRELLMAAPMGRRRLMALDPGFRTGAKLVCLDEQGKLLYYETIYPTHGGKQAELAGQLVKDLCRRFKIEAVAVGNGTASRETEAFISGLGLPESITIVMVNESGASVYSASKSARDEFPDHDVTVRGAVSIGRRLMDPLAELVKIDPKAIGVGQYQHDVDQSALKGRLDDVVTSCVNAVGVEVNTASRELLTYVSGLGPSLAKNIVEWRNTNGPFGSRKQLLKVPRLGPKAFEQAAGFLRIRDAVNPLDGSAVHPESYHIVERMAGDAGTSVQDIMRNLGIRKKIKIADYVTDKVGLPTLEDIIAELAKPGRDPRERFEAFRFEDGVHTIQDLQPGMKLPGIITNVTKFGAFVDVGVHQDGLVHVSQLADRFVADPNEVAKVGQRVTVTVLEVDLPRNRISLSMRAAPSKPVAAREGKTSDRDRTSSKGSFGQKVLSGPLFKNR
ncbi:MAG: Tex family protein [Pseudomonadota bacterium]